MRFSHIILFSLFVFVLACSNPSNNDNQITEAEKRALEVRESIEKANKAIEENMKRGNVKPVQRDTSLTGGYGVDGPYPADKFSIKPTGKFRMFALYEDGKDSVWMSIEAKSENDIIRKYPKLKVYKVRPEWIQENDWFKIRFSCLEKRLLFDINDEPKGWLLENQNKLK